MTPVDPTIDAPGVRGIYCTLPFGDLPKEPDKPHNDAHPFHFGVVGLIHDVPPNGGGFKVWPKSHRRLYPTFWMQYDMARVPSYDHLPSLRGIANSAAYDAELERIGDDTQPVDCWGAAGDVVLWHHRLAHMAGHNYSSVIRQAVLGDFAKTDLDTTRMDPPQADMWRDWSEGLKASAGSYSERPRSSAAVDSVDEVSGLLAETPAARLAGVKISGLASVTGLIGSSEGQETPVRIAFFAHCRA